VDYVTKYNLTWSPARPDKEGEVHSTVSF